MSAFAVVRQFEERVAAFAGARHAIAVNSCTSALFLCLKYAAAPRSHIVIPARTFVSVPMAVVHAGLRIFFDDFDWTGVYRLAPADIVDGALRFRAGMYAGGLHCLSFHARKLLNIGEGGMVLTDDDAAARWLRSAAYSGREGPEYRIEDIRMIGWQCYMTPEKAARGMHLMDYVRDDSPDQEVQYVDLRKVRAFYEHRISADELRRGQRLRSA